MDKNTISRTISVIVIAAIICAAVLYHTAAVNKHTPLPEGSTAELLRYKEGLESTVSELKSEFADKKNELAGLNQKLEELEARYDKLLIESKRIADKLDSLNSVKD